MGKPVKSLASLFSLKFALQCRDSDPRHWMEGLCVRTLLVVTTGNLEDVTLELVAEGVSGNLQKQIPISQSSLFVCV